MKPFKVVSFYDTETTNLFVDGAWKAYPVLFIYNRITCDIDKYVLGCDDVTFTRTEEGFLKCLDDEIKAGMTGGYIPIVCAYNLAFDLQPILERLSQAYQIEVMARASTSIYTLDLIEDGKKVLRFWDTSFLEPRGLSAMGKSCGIHKAVGSWDYSKKRTPETLLSDEELHYAKRDVQVIPAYLANVLKSYPDIEPAELGVKVLTKTSLVRVTAREKIGTLKENGKALNEKWLKTCEIERAKRYEIHAARFACFRGGLTFTAANNACRVFKNCASFDTVSMHHLFINGRYIPRVFLQVERGTALKALESVRNTTLDDVLSRYHNPFGLAFHAHIIIKDLRLKPGSIFEREGIGLLARSKFTTKSHKISAPREAAADTDMRVTGYRDKAKGAVFAFGKLMSADACGVWVSELEYWSMCQVYEFEILDVDYCELTRTMTPPPTYVSLQSSMLYELKRNCKEILETYEEGTPYTGFINEAMSSGYIEELRSGTMDKAELKTYYTQHIKGMYNGIYGTQAMNELKPDYMTDEDGEIVLDSSTVANCENYDERKPYISKVLYPYGLRIVGGSRMHLVIALMLIDGALKDKVSVLGGDTDSIKLSLKDSTVENVSNALKPLHYAVDSAMTEAQKSIRASFPDLASTFDCVGHFECDGINDLEIDMWNKCRVTYSNKTGFTVTCAGLRQDKNSMNIVKVLTRYAEKFGAVQALQLFGYNTVLDYSICQNLQHSKPKTTDVFECDVTDYTGKTSHVSAHESIALYPSSKIFGDLSAQVNLESWLYMFRHGFEVRQSLRRISYDEKSDKVVITENGRTVTL